MVGFVVAVLTGSQPGYVQNTHPDCLQWVMVPFLKSLQKCVPLGAILGPGWGSVL